MVKAIKKLNKDENREAPLSAETFINSANKAPTSNAQFTKAILIKFLEEEVDIIDTHKRRYTQSVVIRAGILALSRLPEEKREEILAEAYEKAPQRGRPYP